MRLMTVMTWTINRRHRFNPRFIPPRGISLSRREMTLEASTTYANRAAREVQRGRWRRRRRRRDSSTSEILESEKERGRERGRERSNRSLSLAYWRHVGRDKKFSLFYGQREKERERERERGAPSKLQLETGNAGRNGRSGDRNG